VKSSKVSLSEKDETIKAKEEELTTCKKEHLEFRETREAENQETVSEIQ